jgi:hypothetical protein
MSPLDLCELNNRIQLLRKLKQVGTDEAFDLTVKRFNDLSEFLGKLLRKEIKIMA